MQLLQARGWYGVFLRADIDRTAGVGDEGEVLAAAKLSIIFRPLVGWCSSEGGFQGLFYEETNRRLVTATKITEPFDFNKLHVVHLGDFCTEETAAVRSLLFLSLIKRVDYFKALYESQYQVTFTKTAQILMVDRRLPLPEETD